ncbi:hypothetical protein GCM10010170_080820 [Dactylosporangium salmoneum]|uniref:inorganic diphosphatase n=1 Tax=Dactylosporangium salmoneum TaxID=53361 RepID=A0ABP5UEN9_9ACTN
MCPPPDPCLGHLRDIEDLERFFRLEIERFFRICVDLDPGAKIDIERRTWADRAKAETEIGLARRRARSSTPAR